MTSLQNLKKYLSTQLFRIKETEPEAAYNLWAASYDDQPDNLMLALDETIFSSLVNDISLQDKLLIDVGCGTGRHWEKYFAKHPKKIIGFDVSEKMLDMLEHKFPLAETHHLVNNKLKNIQDNSCDVIISTLTVAHIKNLKEALQEWNRVLKPGGHMIITDYHPTALAKGGNRTFNFQNKTIAVVNHVHPIEKIMSFAGQLNLTVSRLIEKRIDNTIRHYYEKLDAISIYEEWESTPIIYGIHFKKAE
jgi:ubiquinone/menaquinone biosynthesis C-methylase UbiE